MGIAQAGIVFRHADPVGDLAATLAAVFEETATEILLPVAAGPEPRDHADVLVRRIGDVTFIGSGDLAWPLIRDASRSGARLHAALGAPALMMAFCHDEHRGHHGYAVFEHGRRVRTRLCIGGAGEPTLRASGAPLAFEEGCVQGGAHEASGRLLRDGLQALFGACPWETPTTPDERRFRLGAEPAAAAQPAIVQQPAAQPAAKRAWWTLKLST